jgi:protein required for attachment to host cells
MEMNTSLQNLASVLVADGKKAVLYVNHGDAVLPDLRVEDVIEAPANPPSHEQGTDRPGRSWSGVNRSAMDDTDWHEASEQEFAASLAKHLDKRHQNDPFKALVIVAAPRFLGDLRKHLSPAVQSCVDAELAKDLTHDSVTEIEQLFVRK